MSMDLSPGSLQTIADKVLELDDLKIEVKVVEVCGHDVYLKRENGMHRIVGLTDKTKHVQILTTRG